MTDWVIQNILAGALRPDGWIELVDGLGAPLRDELSDRVSSNDLTEMRVPGVIPLLRRFADREIVRRLFRRLCALAPIIAASKPGDDKQTEAKLARQLQELLRGMAPAIVIDTILLEVGESKDAVEINRVAEIYNIVGREGAPLREARYSSRDAVFANLELPTTQSNDD